MATTSKKIVISGYYGFHNSGDEAVLQSILLALQHEGEAQKIKIEPIVLSADPEFTSKTYGVKAVKRTNMLQVFQTIRSADGLISGGGSLLQDVTGFLTIPYYLLIIGVAQKLNKPTFIYAQGLGPVRRSLFHKWIRQTMIRTAYISVRDEESLNYLQSIGVHTSTTKKPIDCVADPVMGLEPLKPLQEDVGSDEIAGRKLIGVSVRFWKQDRTYLQTLGEALNQLLHDDEKLELQFLPFHMPEDEQATLLVIDKIENQFHTRIHIQSFQHPQEMLAAVGHCSLLIGMRLHALIYAANRQVPLIGISYDPKIDRFLTALQMQPLATTEHLEANTLLAEARKLLANSDQWRSEKAASIAKMKGLALLPARAIISSFTEKEVEKLET